MSEPRDALARVAQALRMVTVPFPHLSGLAAAARVTMDDRLPTMGVYASGRLAVNAGFVSRLNDRDLLFVVAHEMLHLALQTHDRARGASHKEFNIAHDYIINDMLRAELGVETIPASGLDMPGAKNRSAEEIVLEMRRKSQNAASQARVWEGADEDGDVLPDAKERELYPQDASNQRRMIERMRAIAAKSASLAEAMDAMRGSRGTAPGAHRQHVDALRGLYRTPWQLALQRWLEAVAPGEHTFTRASRRTAPQSDVVLPGRRREGWLLNVVLDTSASMSDEIPKALGAIADYCDAAGVDQVRLVQCDAQVTSDELLAPDALATREIAGYGGSDLSPALLHLANDPRTRAAVVVTDGDVEYPREPLPYDVLWVLPAKIRDAFEPRYGRVVTMQ
ncbi:MAG TPA: VWA-like domain-containing protein [Casimicrobiaceae bacterium]|nr:VWA-like domain-containing protein [Casimicrobiaceae bacterium]